MARTRTVAAVVVLGDILRPDGQGRPGGTDRPTLWLANAVRRQIGRAAGLPVEVLLPTRDAALAAWLAAARPVAAADAYWAAHHAALPDDAALAAALLPHLAGRFCLTYEAPPCVLRLLDALGLPWLDVRLHPERFLDDLIFAVRASDAATQAALRAFSVDEGVVLASAGLIEAMGQLISDAAVPEDTLLVVGQRPFDATQIVGGRFFDASTHLDEIARICAAHRAVVLKPHPSGDAHGLLLAAARAPNLLGTIGDNLYRMLALPQVASVLTVNSSVAYEAPYFGKRVYALAALPLRVAWRGEDAVEGAYAACDAALLMPDFWRMALAPHATVSPPDGARLPAKPNRMRIALDSFWNFQEIDTDRIPRQAITAPR